MNILRKSKEKILCSLYPIQSPSELFSFNSLPSLHCKIEVDRLSFSSAGHPAAWPRSAANEGNDYGADETGAGSALPTLDLSSCAGAARSEGWSEVVGPEVRLTPGEVNSRCG